MTKTWILGNRVSLNFTKIVFVDVHVAVSIQQESPVHYCGIFKNRKENMPSDEFCSHFSQDGRLDLIPSPDCYIFIAVSEDTHIIAI